MGPGLLSSEGKTIPPSLKEGDTVLLPEFGGTQVKLGDKEYALCYILHFAYPSTLCFACVSWYICWLFIYIFLFYVLVDFCAGIICIGTRISWALYMTNLIVVI